QSDPADLPALPRAGDLVQGRYHVGPELGRGGMGVVLEAHDVRLGRDVALKIVLPQMQGVSEIVERFSNEARSLAQLESQHVVKVLDFGYISAPPRSAGLPFMALELLRGEDLYELVTRRGPLSPSEVVRYALEACAGLAAAHAHGIIHRDLKPENLFVAIQPDGTECLKVLDFGIARSHSRRALTQGNTGVGSPGYMSPEQVEGHGSLDPRADIWGLGVVMYELLAHRAAFVAETPQGLCLQILTAEVEPLTSLRPDLPPALVYVVERCLRKAPEERFQDVAELAEALAPLDEGVPESDATRIRRRLESSDLAIVPASRLTPVSDPLSAPQRTLSFAPRKRRRVLSALLFLLILVPTLSLLPRVVRAPALAPARAWSERTLQSTGDAWQRARARAHELWMKEPGGDPAAPPDEHSGAN
ncbi:MAG TPA: serine/threonine-protein kinase, partial [Polyangiaceae bacterium]|nr:serine/threonine-protein kinase [Polyangiaceae bacterium]